MNVSFGAHALYSTNVKKLNLNTRKYQRYRAIFVEINPKSKEDVVALSTANDNWNDGLSFLDNILNTISSGYCQKEDKIYALTSQTKDFDNLDPDYLLGVALVNSTNKKYNFISFLQTNPSYEYSYGLGRYFKNIGKSIIRCIKREANDKELKTFPTLGAVNFYKKCGFEESYAAEKYAMYLKNVSSKLHK